METTNWITCALCIIFLRFPLYYLAPVGNISYTDVMNNDTSLCNNSIKQYLSKSEYTKECTTLSYPRNIDKLDDLKYSTMETFLCLGMHDATYKICQYVTNVRWNNTFTKKEDLDFSIQNITGYKPNGQASSKNSIENEKVLCQHLSEYTPTYKKVQPALLKLAESLKDSEACNKICIDIDHKLNPLCAVLAWINRIDKIVANNTITTIHSELGGTSNISNTDDNVPTSGQGKNVITNDMNQQISEASKLKDNISQLPSPINTTLKDAAKEISSLPEKPHNKTTNTIKSQSYNTGVTVKITVSPPVKTLNVLYLESHSNVESHDSAVANAHQSPANVEAGQNLKNQNSNMDVDTNNEALIPPTEEIKSTTLSENTQDNPVEDNALNNRNTDDFSRVDDEQLSSNLMDSLSQPVDADNRNENIPDIPGQREIETDRVIKNDEESHFFTYFAITSLGFIGGYIAYHNKQKILAIVLEGRRSKNNRGRRRPSTANYRKLDCTLEEAVTSQCNANVTHVIY